MPGNPREIITMAERRFPVRIRIAVPLGGFGRRHTQMTGWLDENCGSDGWAMTPSGMRGVLNDAISIYFADATLAPRLDLARQLDRPAKQQQFFGQGGLAGVRMRDDRKVRRRKISSIRLLVIPL
jgi:hypothetical protein